MRPALALAATLVAAPARADLNFVQVTQSQTSAGKEGLFGKTWVELRGERMRLVSGYARKVDAKGEAPDPRRRVQILDVGARTRTVVDPTRRSYAVSALGPPDYGNGMAESLGRGTPQWRVLRHELRLEKAAGTRTMLGAVCERWKVTVVMRLSALNGREEAARMDQNLWVAPLTGDLAKSLMELLSFENSYRAGVKGSLSPLDHERYQVREAAAYLQVPEAQLAAIVAEVREKLRELPSYPVASSVAWWRDEGRSVRPPEAAGRPPEAAGRPPEAARPKETSLGDVRPRDPQPPQPAQPPRASWTRRRSPFRVINWRREERRIDRLFQRTRSEFGEFPLGPIGPADREGGGPEPRTPREPAVPARRVAPRFEEELRRILDDLMAVEAALDEAARRPSASGPFFEIYAELHGLESPAPVSVEHFKLPEKFRRVDRLPDGI